MESDLNRFVEAQEGIYEGALSELRKGRKNGHWMWFIFPQFQGLGASPTSKYFAIRSLKEARAYLANPRLGSRLLECTKAVLSHTGVTAEEIFGYPDVLKFCSSMTLFERASAEDSLFSEVLEKYYKGKRDSKTLKLLQQDEC